MPTQPVICDTDPASLLIGMPLQREGGEGHEAVQLPDSSAMPLSGDIKTNPSSVWSAARTQVRFPSLEYVSLLEHFKCQSIKSRMIQADFAFLRCV